MIATLSPYIAQRDYKPQPVNGEADNQTPLTDTTSEESLLGIVLENADSSLGARIVPDDLSDLRLRLIARTIRTVSLSGQKPAPEVIVPILRDAGQLNEAGGLAFVSGLGDAPPPSGIFDSLLKRVADLATRRSCIEDLAYITRKFSDPSTNLRSIASGAAVSFAGIAESGSNADELTARSIGELEPRPRDDADEFIRHRFLNRAGSLLIVAPSGIGKSVLALQWALCLAVGRDCLGLLPTRPLRSLLIQAEDDDGDLLEQRDGILAGLRFTDAERKLAFENVVFRTVDDQCGPDFISKSVGPLCEKYHPDIVWINPLLAYLGGDVSRQEVVGPWLRNHLNPVLHRTGAACVLVHHTNKPATGKEKPNFQAGDFAYVGAGSADLANWARAVIAIRSIGDHAVYELHLGKRGGRAGWKNEDGTTCYSKLIAHGTDGIYWREAPEDERPATGGRKQEHTVDDILDHLDGEKFTTAAWAERCHKESGISERAFYRLKKLAVTTKKVHQSKIDSTWFRA